MGDVHNLNINNHNKYECYDNVNKNANISCINNDLENTGSEQRLISDCTLV